MKEYKDPTEEITQGICENTRLNDEKFQAENEDILKIENQLKNTFSPSQLKLYMQLEEKVIRSSTHVEESICRAALKAAITMNLNPSWF